MRRYQSILVLGGAGLVGYQVCRYVLREGMTSRIVVASLRRDEVQEALGLLRKEFPKATVTGRYGNVFARGRLADADTEEVEPITDRRDPKRRRELLADIYESFDGARAGSALVQLVEETRPSAVVDCINTATGISYQDVPTAAKQIMADLGLRGSGAAVSAGQFQADVEGLLVSIEIPQLILHVRLLVDALRAARTETYVKVGTTGTGGMGLNIPFTHGEDKPSPTLMAKTAVAFAHTGLLFLADRTEGGPSFKELKPAAMIGYKAVAVQTVPGYVWEKQGDRFVKRRVPARPLYEARRATLEEPLDTTPDPSAFAPLADETGRSRTMQMACVNTGENGWFSHGEFEAITALDQMEIVTPEEIARAVVHELAGRSTGLDVIAGLDATIMGPTFKGGLVRQIALDRITLLEGQGSVPSVAIGDLGPPQLSKYLFELHLAKAVYGTLEKAIQGLPRPDAGKRLAKVVEERPDLRSAIVSVGIPILLPDGKTFLRGPEVKIPGYDPSVAPRRLTPAEVDAFAAKGWVDLRSANLARWADRLTRVLASRRGGSAGASDALAHDTYGRDDFRPGEVVAWIFANEPEFRGFRIK
jgi:hypothetical protein